MASYSLAGPWKYQWAIFGGDAGGQYPPSMGGHVGPPLPPLPFTENGKIKDLLPHGLGMGLPNLSIFNG